MGLIPSAHLDDGTWLTFIVGENRHVYAMERNPVGSYPPDWVDIGDRGQFTSQPEVHTDGRLVLVDITGKGEGPERGAPDYWAIWRCEYVHDTTKVFAKRFSKWRYLGAGWSRLFPILPPFPEPDPPH